MLRLGGDSIESLVVSDEDRRRLKKAIRKLQVKQSSREGNKQKARKRTEKQKSEQRAAPTLPERRRIPPAIPSQISRVTGHAEHGGCLEDHILHTLWLSGSGRSSSEPTPRLGSDPKLRF